MDKLRSAQGWMSVDDVAGYLGIKRGTVYKWIERYGLPAKKIGRLLKFRRAEVESWMERQRPANAGDATAGRFLRLLQKEAPEIKKRFGVRKIGLFGSTVRGDAGPASDVDVLVEFENTAFDRYMDLKFYLEDLFGRPCDLVLEESLKERLRGSVMGEVLYA